MSYTYQMSGHGAPELNDGTWCPTCKSTINEALRQRPKLYEMRYRDVSELTEWYQVPLETLLKWEQELYARRKASTDLADYISTGQRIWPGLIDRNTGEFQSTREIVGEGDHRNIRFRVSTWTKRPDETKIEVPMEWDVKRGQWTGDDWV